MSTFPGPICSGTRFSTVFFQWQIGYPLLSALHLPCSKLQKLPTETKLVFIGLFLEMQGTHWSVETWGVNWTEWIEMTWQSRARLPRSPNPIPCNPTCRFRAILFWNFCLPCYPDWTFWERVLGRKICATGDLRHPMGCPGFRGHSYAIIYATLCTILSPNVVCNVIPFFHQFRTLSFRNWHYFEADRT